MPSKIYYIHRNVNIYRNKRFYLFNLLGVSKVYGFYQKNELSLQ